MSTFQEMRRALEALNNLYGRGTVTEIKLFMDGRGLFVRKPFGCKEETRVFHVIGRTMYALGHQRRIPVIS